MTPPWIPVLLMLVDEVHDGDTIYGRIDHGVGVETKGPGRWGFRIAGLNCRELAKPGGGEARDYLRSLVPVGARLPFESLEWDKYGGRLDVRLSLPGVGDLAEHLIAEGWAARWNGRGTAPVPPWPRVAP